MEDITLNGLSELEYHVLLALTDGPLYGYALLQAVRAESQGEVNPRAGSLYRVLARLMSWGFVVETDPHDGDREAHPGLERRYYAITKEGLRAVRAQARRFRRAAELADRRLGLDGVE